jgi:hypothetical protein
MCVPYDKTFLLVPKFVTLKFDPLFKKFNIGHIFWMVSDRLVGWLFTVLRPAQAGFLPGHSTVYQY